MQKPRTNSTSSPMNGEESGSDDTSSMQLDPWEIAHLLICKRDEQPINIEFATDDEFDTWIRTNSIPIKENGISGWSFDDRCRVINYVLANGHSLEFVDGIRIPEDEEEKILTQPLQTEQEVSS